MVTSEFWRYWQEDFVPSGHKLWELSLQVGSIRLFTVRTSGGTVGDEADGKLRVITSCA